MDVSEILEAWRTHNGINLLLLDEITDEGLGCTLSTRGGRNVARQFAHLHDVRIYHLENRTPDLADGLEKFQAKGRTPVSPDRQSLKDALSASGLAIETFLRDLADPDEDGPRRRGFRKGIATTLAYFVAHESHHRGSILLTLKQSGHGLDRAVAYRIWDWDRL